MSHSWLMAWIPRFRSTVTLAQDVYTFPQVRFAWPWQAGHLVGKRGWDGGSGRGGEGRGTCGALSHANRQGTRKQKGHHKYTLYMYSRFSWSFYTLLIIVSVQIVYILVVILINCLLMEIMIIVHTLGSVDHTYTCVCCHCACCVLPVW